MKKKYPNNAVKMTRDTLVKSPSMIPIVEICIIWNKIHR